MADPITLAMVGGAVLQEGVSFLFGQAGEVLKRWRGRRDKDREAEQIEAQLPADVFAGDVAPLVIHFDAVAAMEDDIKQLVAALGVYASGAEEPRPEDPELAQAVDGLRSALEAVFRQRLTFVGEQRPTSGPAAEADIDIEHVKGYVAGIRVKTVESGTLKARLRANNVAEGAEAVGIDIDRLGGN